MSIQLAEPIASYFRAANAHDSTALATCFAPDAVVQDEGQRYHGLPQIMEWNERASKQYALLLEPMSMSAEEGKVLVTARATGNFEGSPADIDFAFVLENERIAHLSCG